MSRRVAAGQVAPGRTALAELVERSSRGSWIVRAVGAAFERKDDLKARGYRWDSDARVWCREVADRDDEEGWLMMNVYAPFAGQTSAAPEWRQITARERWG